MINTVLFDMGGTLEDIWYDDKTTMAITQSLIKRLNQHGVHIDCKAPVFWNRLYAGVKRYRQWSEMNEIEKKPEEIWSKYYLSDFLGANDNITEIAEELAEMWEVTHFHRELRPGVKEMLELLKTRGYKLGIISNTTSLYQVFHSLEHYGIRKYFDDVTLSSITGYRKPNPSIFQIALHQIQSRPEECAYVGDTLSRDVIGAKRLSFGAAVQIRSFLSAEKDIDVDATCTPDCIVTNIMEVVDYLDSIKEKTVDRNQ